MLPLRHYANHKVFPLILWDGLGIFFAFLIALAFRFDGRIPSAYLYSFLRATPFVILLYCVINVPFGLYARIWRYTSAQEVVVIAGSTATSTAILILFTLVRETKRPLPLSVVLLGGLFTVGAFTIIRYRQRVLTGVMARLQRVVGTPDRQRVLIVGAGESGQFLARQLQTHSQRHRYELVGFVDDDPAKLGMSMHSVSILGNRHAIPNLVVERKVGLLVISIHNIPGSTLRDILSICLDTQVRVKIQPDFLKLMGNPKESLPLRDITPIDLLGRQPHQIDETACRELISGKTILVTGAAGSIGSELCRQLLNFHPRQLLMLDNNETGLHDLSISFRQCPSVHLGAVDEAAKEIKSIVADITNPFKIAQIFKTYRPQIIFHAAAYKHVPLMEQQPEEAVRVNILGTKIVSELATRYAAECFVLISTDKAINPSSIMGATKRLGEMMIMSNVPLASYSSPLVSSLFEGFVMNSVEGTVALTSPGDNLKSVEKPALSPAEETTNGRQQGLPPARAAREQEEIQCPTLFTAVRFGNVLGSRGSVVPTFTQQIELGGPVTVTHPEMTRYFMSISEAVSLVIQAATLTEGGDIFMLDMGQQIRIADLAHKMIRLRGLRPEKDIPIEYTGVRPGEKLHEELLAPDEARLPTSHPKIFRLRHNGRRLNGRVLARRISYLIELTFNQDSDKIVNALWQLVQINDRQQTIDDQPSPINHHPQFTNEVGEKRLWN